MAYEKYEKKAVHIMKKYEVAIIGCGSRGRDAYGRIMHTEQEKWRIAALCDIDSEQLQRTATDFGVKQEDCFISEEEFFLKKRADVLVIATQDRDHVRMCCAALKLGYDVLLEKPISPVKEELSALLRAQKEYGGKVVVCHVLRYAPAFLKIKQFLDSGVIGKLVCIEALEQVGYWHHSHSFVRGNWRKESDTSPIILAKCCHDLDLLSYFVGSRCKDVYSVGGVRYFNRENQPQGAAERCFDCQYRDECIYSAERLYIERWKKFGSPENCWPFNVVDIHVPNTEAQLREAYKNGPYGQCVFACDNDVADHQTVTMHFDNDVVATLTLTGFTDKLGRRMVFHGTHGQIELNETTEKLILTPFGQEETVIDTATLVADLGEDSFGHGGGDVMIVRSLYDVLSQGARSDTSLEKSVESHWIALAAEESRKSGKAVRLQDVCQ